MSASDSVSKSDTSADSTDATSTHLENETSFTTLNFLTRDSC